MLQPRKQSTSVMEEIRNACFYTRINKPFFCCSFYLLPDQKMSHVPLSFCMLIGSVLSAALVWLIVSVWLCSRGPIDYRYIMLLMYASLSQDSAGITAYPQLVCMRDNFTCVPVGSDFRNGQFATM